MYCLKVSASFIFLSAFLSLVVVNPCAASAGQASAQQIAGATNIVVSQVLVPVVDELLASSPSFAAQFQRIAMAKYVRVVVNPVMASSTVSRGSARASIRRFSSGALIVTVEMPVPLTTFDYAELFGHEFEHILEQMEHVDLEELSATRSGARRLSDGAYETTRARRAGQAIAVETEQPKSVSTTEPVNGSAQSLRSARQQD